MIRRVELYGGPGIGKSTLAHDITSVLSKNGIKTDYIEEECKNWAYRKQRPESWDQLHLFNSQLQNEYNKLKNGVDVVVTDSPVLMNVIYGYRYKSVFANDLYDMSNQFDKDFPPLRILLQRTDSWYKEHGRYEDLNQAKDMDSFIESMLKGNHKPHSIWNNNFGDLITTIRKENTLVDEKALELHKIRKGN